MQKYVIIGSGAAGVAAAEAIRGQDREGEILMIMAEKDGYYSRPGLAYYLSKEIPENSLFPFSDHNFHVLAVKRLQDVAVKIDPQSHSIALQSGKDVPYDKLLVSVGAQAVRPDLPGLDLDGVVYLDMLNGTRSMIKRSRGVKTAVVAGGGITALEMVEGLRVRGVRVHFLLRSGRYWGSVLDETESLIIEHRLIEEGVVIHYHTEINSVIGKRGRVVGVELNSGSELKCQMAAFAIGVRPRLQLARSSGLDTDRGILVNEYLQTSQPDVYAAGDVAQVYDPTIGKAVVDSLWFPARRQGYTAGLNMAGQQIAYIKGVPFNVTRLAGLTTTIIGTVGTRHEEDSPDIVRGESQTWHQIPDAIACQNNFDVNRLRLMVGKSNILGALVMGNQTLSQPLQQLVTEKVDITPIRSELIKPGAPIADIITNFWTMWREKYAA